MANAKTQVELDEEQEQRLRAVSLLQRQPSPRKLAEMQAAMAAPPIAGGQGGSSTLRVGLEQAQRMTAWAQAEGMFGLLKDISDHCRRTANELERNLMELEAMLGKMPKRP